MRCRVGFVGITFTGIRKGLCIFLNFGAVDWSVKSSTHKHKTALPKYQRRKHHDAPTYDESPDSYDRKFDFTRGAAKGEVATEGVG